MPIDPMRTLLHINNLRIVYDHSILAVHDVSLSVPQAAIVALLGSNGAGKSTVLKAVSGVLAREKGEIVDGGVSLDCSGISHLAADAIVRRGVAQVPEGRALFADLTVEENLVMGGYTRPAGEAAATLEEVYTLFPRAKERRRQAAGYLSGGEQQMVALGRALMSRPRLLLMDEPSLGLAPQIVETIFEAIVALNRDSGLTVLLVEQNARLALSVAHYCYIMENGRIVLDGRPEHLATNADVQDFFLGRTGSDGVRRSMRDVKHYKRRKRWLA